MTYIKLYGRVIISGSIRALSGLRIGGSTTNLEIGGVDLPVVRNIANGQPYIPGSSLKGKMRSLSEKLTAAPLNRSINGIFIHTAEKRAEYDQYWVNPIFGVPSEVKFEVPAPNRLLVRDIQLDPTSLEAARANFDLPYTEVKWENALDRVTSAATPRQIERVPAGAIFKPMELVFNLYFKEDVQLLQNVFIAMQLVEDDYLGGHGSRGSGKVAFENLNLDCKGGDDYRSLGQKQAGSLSSLNDQSKTELINWIDQQFAPVFANGKG